MKAKIKSHRTKQQVSEAQKKLVKMEKRIKPFVKAKRLKRVSACGNWQETTGVASLVDK